MARNQITLEQYIGFRKKKSFGEKRKINVGKVVSFAFLLLFCIIWLSPFVIMFFGSLRGFTDTMLYPKELFYPHSGYTLENYEMLLLGKLPEGIGQVNAVQDYKIGTWFMNSCFSAIGGTLLYSTCTLRKAENEERVLKFLENNKNFELTPFKVGSISAENGFITLFPCEKGTDGFFIAKLKRIL